MSRLSANVDNNEKSSQILNDIQKQRRSDTFIREDVSAASKLLNELLDSPSQMKAEAANIENILNRNLYMNKKIF